MLRTAVVILAVLVGGPALAQVDTLTVEPPDRPAPVADTLEVAADTIAVNGEEAVSPAEPPRPVLMLPRSPSGDGLTGFPARRPVFSTPALFDHVPGSWRYDLGVFGAPDGVALGLTPPGRLALSLDGVPTDDLFTGRAALERLPTDLLAPLHFAPGLYGAPGGIRSHTRAFMANVPITELRYRAGPDGHQSIGVTHAQTRRPGFVQRLGGDLARMSALVHIGADMADGEYQNASLSGFQAIARVGLALPGLAIEATNRHFQRTEGAWGGVDPGALDIFDREASVRDFTAQRETIHNDLSLRLRADLITGAPPLLATAYWTAATHRFTRPDTTEARGHRYGLMIEQRLAVAEHRLSFSADLRAGSFRGGTAFSADAQPLAPEAHLTVQDSLSLAGLGVTLAAGVHLAPDVVFPTGRVEIGRGEGTVRGRVAAFVGGARLSPVERLGFGEFIAVGELATERAMGLEGSAAVQLGPLTLDASGEVRRRTHPRLLVLEDVHTASLFSLDGALTQLLGTFGIGFREEALRGFYLRAWVAVHSVLEAAESDLHRAEADALPPLYGFGRFGFRAAGLFDDALDLDLFLRGRAWAAHRGRVLHAPTALFALPDPSSPRIPGRGVLDIVLDAGIARGRARVFVAYQNALDGIAYPGVFTVPIYPLPEPSLRAGIFWILAN